MSRPGRTTGGLTLVELIVVVVVLAVLTAVVVPKLVSAGTRTAEQQLRSDLKHIRNVIVLFYNDTGTYPATLKDLGARSAPAFGLVSDGTTRPVDPADWHGPYMDVVPNDPVSGRPFTYSTTVGSIGNVTSSATGDGMDGTTYSSW